MKSFHLHLIAAAMLAHSPAPVQAQWPGEPDPLFDAGSQVNVNVCCVVPAGDGKVYIGGSFTTVRGAVRNRIARLNPDGTVDSSFNPFNGANGSVHSIVLQADGKLIVAGTFSTIGNTWRKGIARLHSSGAVDFSFDPGTGANEQISVLAIQDDGKVLIGGWFTSYNGTTRNRIARLNSDGSLDTGFNPGSGANGVVETLAIQVDGKVVIGGAFTSLNGTSRNRIARLNTSGSLDTGFNPGSGANNDISSLSLQADGKVVIGGWFTSYNGTSRNRIARVNSNGSLDANFSGIGTNDLVEAVAVQPDGKVLIGGWFTSVNSSPRTRFARLHTHGGLDFDFSVGSGVNDVIDAISVQEDGAIWIGGWFTSYNGQARGRVAKLNPNGVLEAGFVPGTGASAHVNAAVTQADGKILIGGAFTSYSGAARGGVARLHGDGSLDASFDPGAGANGTVSSVIAKADNRVLIAGEFTSFNGTGRNRIAQLTDDGSLDAAFNPGSGANGKVSAMAVLPDGKILVVGAFTSFSGTGRNRVARLNANGSLDSAFNPGTGANDEVYSVAVQPDGKVIIGGWFSSYNGTGRGRVARLNANGSLDTSFNPGTGVNGAVTCVALLPDGKVMIGGSFSHYNGVQRGRIARIHSDGSLDTAFDPGMGLNGEPYSMMIQADGKVLIGGGFTSYAGQGVGYATKLHANAARVSDFYAYANSTIFSLAGDPDGKILLSGFFSAYFKPTAFVVRAVNHGHQSLVAINRTRVEWNRGANAAEVEQVTIEYSADGTVWSNLGSPSRSGLGWEVTQLNLPASGHLRARGRTTGGQYNGSSGLIEQVASFAFHPEIAVEQPAGTNLVSGAAHVDFGSDQPGAGGASTERVFTVRNTGTATLTEVGVSLSGENAADFSVTASPADSVAPGQFTAFTVAFAPGSPGPKSAILEIASNDADENPFLVTLTGLALPPSSNAQLSGLTVSGGVLSPAFAPDVTDYVMNVPFRTSAVTVSPTADHSGAAITLNKAPAVSGAAIVVPLSVGTNAITVAVTAADGMTQQTYAVTIARGAPGSGVPGLPDGMDFSVEGPVSATAVQPDGKIIIGGYFISVLGVQRNRVARLNVDGTLDASFNPNANDAVEAVVLQPDGKILLGGYFTTLQPNGAASPTARWGIARLHADGTLDAEFDPKADGTVRAMSLLPDGKIMVGGEFGALQPNGAAHPTFRRGIVRLDPDGGLDSGFDFEVSTSVNAVAVQPDGKILLGGLFNSVKPNGKAWGEADVARDNMVRLHADGTLDESFNAGVKAGAVATVLCLVPQPDGKILAGGYFTSIVNSGVATDRTGLARLMPDGTLDAAFDPRPSGAVYTMALQADGSILIGGMFESLEPHGVAENEIPIRHVARLAADGTVDADFAPNPERQVFSIALQRDGRILLGGDFDFFEPEGSEEQILPAWFARLENDAVEESLLVLDGTRVQWLRGGSAPEVTGVGFEVSTDGLTYAPLAGTPARIGGRSAHWELGDLELPAAGYLRARARTAGGACAGSSGIIEAVATFGDVAPQLAVEQPEGTPLVSGSAQVDFGTVTVGANSARTFTLRNHGLSALSGLGVNFAGPDAPAFALTSAPATSLAPGGSTSFEVVFSPSAPGLKTAELQLTSDELASPFVITLTGAASLNGPVYPAPGGNSFTGSGNAGQSTGRTNFYTNIGTDGMAGLWWTFHTIANPRHSSQAATGNMVLGSYDADTGIATFVSTANMIWNTATGTRNIATRLRMQLQPYTGTHTGPIGADWLTPAAAGAVGAGGLAADWPLADVLALGAPHSFQVWHRWETADGTPLLDYYNASNSLGGSTQTSISGGFYYDASPAEIALSAAIFTAEQGAEVMDVTLARSGGLAARSVTLSTSAGTALAVPPFAAGVAGVDYQPLTTTVEFAEGELSKTVPITLIPRAGTKVPNTRFTVTLTDPTPGAVLGAITTAEVRVLAIDSINPTLAVKTPGATAANISLAAPYLVTGTAGDAKGIDRVEVVLNGGAPIPADLGVALKPTSVPFSAAIVPVEGTNTLEITAYDLRGNSTTVLRVFDFLRRYLVTVARSVPEEAAGTPDLAGTVDLSSTKGLFTALAPKGAGVQTGTVVPGEPVVLTAKAMAGFSFSHWLGMDGVPGAVQSSNTLRFTMPAADVEGITAVFIVNPFLGLGAKAQLYGLLEPQDGTDSSNGTHGSITVTLTTKSGALSGKVLIDGKALPFAGAAMLGDGSVWFKSGGLMASTATLADGRLLSMHFEAGKACVTLLGLNGEESAGIARPAIYSATDLVSAELLNRASKAGGPMDQGFFTVAFPARDQSPPKALADYPQGTGYGSITLAKNGTLKLAGVLADGSKFTAASALVQDDRSPVHAQLITPGAASTQKGGSLLGTLVFDPDATDSDVSGADLRWFRPAVTEQSGATAAALATQLYTDGWPEGITVDAVGAFYDRTVTAQESLGLIAADPQDGNARLLFEDGQLAGAVEVSAFNINGNSVAKLDPKDKSFTLGFTTASGLMKGTFTPDWSDAATKLPAFNGVLLQKGGSKGGYGFFISNRTGDSDPQSGSVELNNPHHLPGFARIEGGATTIGRTSGDTDGNAPPISVNVSTFYLQETETTKAQWDAVRTWAVANGYPDLPNGGGKGWDHPVYSVSWYAAVKWCNARSEMEGLAPCYHTDEAQTAVYRSGTADVLNTMVNWNANGYRLPTEAEWEKAARGGLSGRRFPWGTDRISHAEANFNNSGTESYQEGPSGYHLDFAIGSTPYTSPAGAFAANGYGLFDMAGNVREWCWDWYDAGHYSSSNGTTNPLGPLLGTSRIPRGGSWQASASGARCAVRYGTNPAGAHADVGFRPVRSRP